MEKISLLDLYNILNDVYRELPEITSKLINLTKHEFSRFYDYSKDLSLYLSAIRIIKGDPSKIVIDYRYIKSDGQYDFDFAEPEEYVLERIAISKDEKGDFRILPIEMINTNLNLEKMPKSILSKPWFRLFNKDSMYKIFDILEGMDSDLDLYAEKRAYHNVYYSYDSTSLQPIYIKVPGIIFDNERCQLSINVCDGIVYLNLHYEDSSRRGLSLSKRTLTLYEKIQDLASETYINLDTLPENLVKYINKVQSQNGQVNLAKVPYIDKN